MTPSLPPTTARDRELLDRLAQHEPLSTSELCLLFFTGLRTCRERLVKLHTHDLLTRVYPTRVHRGGRTEALWLYLFRSCWCQRASAQRRYAAMRREVVVSASILSMSSNATS